MPRETILSAESLLAAAAAVDPTSREALTKLRDDEIVRSLRRLGEGRGFAVERQVIEARGLCPTCRTGQGQA